MKSIGTITLPQWGKCSVHVGTYGGPDGPLAVVLKTDTGEPLTKLSVNMYKPECSHDSSDLPAGCFYAKTYGENDEIARLALASGMFIERPDLPKAHGGHVTVPVWQLAGVAS